MERERWTGGAARRIAFVFVVLLWTVVGEDFAEGGWRFWYDGEFFGIPTYYLIVAGTLAILFPFVSATPRASLVGALKRSSLFPWLVLGWVALIMALARAILEAAPDPFVDWRDLFVLALVAALAFRWLSAQPWREWALVDLAVGFGLVSLGYLIAWASGAGVQVFGLRVPTFHASLLNAATFGAFALVLVWATAISTVPPFYGFLVRLGAVTNSAMILLSFRRSWWLAWGVGMAVVLYSLLRGRWGSGRGALGLSVTLIGVVVSVFIILGGDTVVARLQSFVPDADNQFSATNEDHLNDIRDALAVVMREPILGYGIGEYYETNLIADWKTESFDVHNALIHVWLKFGIVGAIAYAGFHIQWVKSAWRTSASAGPAAVALMATAVYIGTHLLASLVGTWPYGSVQTSILHGILLTGVALAFTNAESRSSRAAISSMAGT